jgi:hypothetical protein
MLGKLESKRGLGALVGVALKGRGEVSGLSLRVSIKEVAPDSGAEDGITKNLQSLVAGKRALLVTVREGAYLVAVDVSACWSRGIFLALGELGGQDGRLASVLAHTVLHAAEQRVERLGAGGTSARLWKRRARADDVVQRVKVAVSFGAELETTDVAAECVVRDAHVASQRTFGCKWLFATLAHTWHSCHFRRTDRQTIGCPPGFPERCNGGGMASQGSLAFPPVPPMAINEKEKFITVNYWARPKERGACTSVAEAPQTLHGLRKLYLPFGGPSLPELRVLVVDPSDQEVELRVNLLSEQSLCCAIGWCFRVDQVAAPLNIL